MQSPKQVATNRPTESSTTVIGAVVGITVFVFPKLQDISGYLIILMGALPGLVTWLVNTKRKGDEGHVNDIWSVGAMVLIAGLVCLALKGIGWLH